LKGVKDAARLVMETPSSIRERKLLTVPLKQDNIQLFFQLAHMLTHPGLGHVQPLGGAGEMVYLYEGAKAP
jgi:hypothetical protein